jgi:phenylalanyl-tRNA synthetase beta subunit
MKLSEQILQVRNWLVDQKDHLMAVYGKDTKHFDAQLVDLTQAAEKAKKQEAALQLALEIQTGEAVLDDADFVKHLDGLRTLLDKEPEDGQAQQEE